MPQKPPKLNWTNVYFFIITPFIGIIGTVLLCHLSIVKWQTWLFFGIYLYITMLAITAGYHRLFAHKSYHASLLVRFLMVMLGAACFQGSALEFATDHRDHHRYSDTEKDLYSINNGFWYAHIGWIFYLDLSQRNYANVPDLISSTLLRFQHRYFTAVASFMGFIFPALIAACWGNALAGLIIVGVLRMVINHHSTFFINSLCHYSGKQTYSEKQTARDNWFTALVTMGEGFHNFHHQFPLDYRNGIRYFHYDPTKWLIYGLSKLGLASHLKRVNRHKILSFQLRVEESRLKRKYQQHTTFITQKIEPLQAHLFTLIEKIVQLEAELITLRDKKYESIKDHYQDYKEQLKSYLSNLKLAQQELNDSLSCWRRLFL